MDYNILKIVIDRAGRVTQTQNLSLSQCSNNNRIKVYYEGDYDYIEMSFRKPDGWLSDKVSLTFDVDDENYKYAYYDIEEDFTSFVMGGRNAILVANVYLHSKIDGVAKIASLGNIRINVNYVDDALVHTNYSQAYMHNINSQIGSLQNELNRFKLGDVLIGKAVADRKGNTIDIYYETKADALDKYDDLNQKKLDRSEVQDQTNRLNILETNVNTSGNRLTAIESELDTREAQIDTNTSNIEILSTSKVSSTDFDKVIAERIIAETNLQAQIDDISITQNVRDIVGTRADLFAYDTSKLEVGERIQVMTDAAYSSLTTIYRWNGTSFEFVGKYTSTSYTKAESDAITTAVRSTIANKILPEDNSIYLYKDSTKVEQDSPVTFKTINGTSILGSGNISTDNTDAAFSTTSANPVQNKLITAALSNKADKIQITNLENSISEKANASELSKKQDKLTAGANVTISDTGVISVSSAIKFSKVDTLPAQGESNIIYLLRTTEKDYTEYVWIDDKWETLGDARISLENYYTISEINELLVGTALQADLERLSDRVSTNTAELVNKADANTTSTSISILNNSVNNLTTEVASKADASELEKFALKEDIPDITVKQDKLVSGQNIKTINGVNILGYGDLLIADTEIVDLGNYVLRTENEEALALKADKTELFNKDYNALNNLPNLDVFATNEDVEGLKTYVDESIAGIPKPDMSEYYTKTEVDEAIENVDVSDQLENFYTKEEVDTAISNVDVTDQLADYAKQSWVEEQRYIKTEDASDIFAIKSDIPTIPGNVSAFANDAGYSTVTYVDTEIDKVEQSITNLIGGAPTAYDTLKEIADYISSDKTGSSEMLAAINTNRSNISTLRTDLNSEITNRNSAVNKVQSNLDTYKNSTNSTLSTHTSNISTLQKGLSSEITNRENAVKDVKDDLTTETNERKAADTQLQTNITTEVNDRKAAIVAEETARSIADNTLQGNIDTLSTSLEEYITEADEKYLEYSEYISRSEGIIDYTDTTKAKVLKLSTDSNETEFVISNTEVDSIVSMLAMMVPNEY